MFGYKVSATQLILEKDVKDSFSVKRVRPNSQSYLAISKRLPCYYPGATPPRPAPGHLLSALSGVCKRVSIKTPTSDPKTMNRFRQFVYNWLRHHSGLKPLSPDQIYTFEQWLEETPYSETRKKELEEIWNVKYGRKPTRRELRKVKCFIKDETYPAYKFPRGIYSRSDAAKCMFGSYVASVAAQVFKLKWFIKNIPVVDRPSAIYNRLHKINANYVFTDYTAYESHFTEELMNICDGQLYDFMYSKSSAEHKANMKLFMDIKTGKQKMTFKMFDIRQDAGRMSGEMDTSLGNGFANLMLFLFVSSEIGYDIDDIKGYVEGDDGLFRMGEIIPTENDFAKLGMTIKIGVTKKLSEASFCGQVYDVEEGVVVTDVKEVISRLGWTNKQYVKASPQLCLELLRSRAYSLVYQYGKCPILGVLGKRLLELTDGIKVRDTIQYQMDQWDRSRYREAMVYLDKNGIEVTGVPGPNTRMLVEKLYGITVDEQRAIEEQISHMSLGALPFEFETIDENWRHYYENYSVPQENMIPSWIKFDDSKLAENLIGVKAIDDATAIRIIRG